MVSDNDVSTLRTHELCKPASGCTAFPVACLDALLRCSKLKEAHARSRRH